MIVERSPSMIRMGLLLAKAIIACGLFVFRSHQDKVDASEVVERNQQYTCHDDVSWAVNSQDVRGRKDFYWKFIEGCGKALDPAKCQSQENFRMQMNMFQPRSVYNYTKAGFLKRKAPAEIFSVLKDFWEKNRQHQTEEWTRMTTYHNNWEVHPTTVVRVDNKTLLGGGPELTLQVLNAARQLLEEWTGMRQAHTSIWGIRVYHNRSVLAPHVDRLPLVSSVIINVDQDVDEPWPLEVYDHDGIAHNVTLDPGDMLLYESHSVIHGRPFPLNGSHFAGVFIHFEPIAQLYSSSHATNKYDLPPYIIPGSSWEPEWRDLNPDGWRLLKDPWHLAERGDLNTLEYLATMDPSQLHKANGDGFSPLFFACREGHLDVVRYLIEEGGVNVNAVAVGGATPLRIADNKLGKGHAVSEYLRSKGARATFDSGGRVGAEITRSEL